MFPTCVHTVFDVWVGVERQQSGGEGAEFERIRRCEGSVKRVKFVQKIYCFMVSTTLSMSIHFYTSAIEPSKSTESERSRQPGQLYVR